MSVANYHTYSDYSQGAAPWLGEVPSAWPFERAKWHLRYEKELNSSGNIENVLSLTLRGVVNNDPDNPEGLVPKDYRTYQIFECNDLVFKLIDLENVRTSRVGLVHEQGIMSSAYIRISPPKDWNSRFLYYFYYNLYQSEVFNKIGSGVRSTLGQADLLDLPLPVLALSTQNAIAAFLDGKCAKIDEAVRIKEEQIALLRERRQILIQQAVTRGLNPDAPMKDSGIDGSERVPAHWDVKPCRYAFRSVRRSDRNGFEMKLSVTQRRGLVPTEEMEESSTQASSFDSFQLCHENDLVLNKYKAHLGVFWMAHQRGIITNNYTVFKPLNGVNSRFFEALFHTAPYLTLFRKTVYGVVEGMMPLYTNDFYGLPAICPPPEEQASILLHIDEQKEKFAHTILLKEQQIAALKEYKTSLINAAVTGKIKIT